MSERRCQDCQADISDRRANAKYCRACARRRQQDSLNYAYRPLGHRPVQLDDRGYTIPPPHSESAAAQRVRA